MSVSSFQMPDDVAHLRLAAEHALGADLARHARHLGRERVERVDHRVDRVLQRDQLAARLDRDLAATRSPFATAVVTSAMSRTWLVRLLRHLVDVVGQLLPDARHVLDVGRARRACPRCRPGARRGSPRRRTGSSLSTVALIVFLSARISPRASTPIFLPRSPPAIAVMTSAMLRTCDVRFDAMPLTFCGQLAPHAGHVGDLGLAAEHALGADLARDARHLGGERRQLIDHDVDRVLERRGSRPWPRR